MYRAQCQPNSVAVKLLRALAVFLSPRAEEGVVVGRRVARKAPDILAVGHGGWQALAGQVVQGCDERVRRCAGDGQVAPCSAGERSDGVHNCRGGQVPAKVLPVERGIPGAGEGDVCQHCEVGTGCGDKVMFAAVHGAADEEVVYGGGADASLDPDEVGGHARW